MTRLIPDNRLLPDHLHELAWEQAGALTRAQVSGGGLSRATLRTQLERGRWQRLQTGVYGVFSGPPSRDAVLWAAVLRTGPGAMLSYHTAAEVSGLADRPGEVIHVTVPGERYIERIRGIVVHRSARAAMAAHPVQLPPRSRVEETVLDLAGTAGSLDEACGWVTRALGRRLTTPARLREAMEARAKMRWRRELAQALSPDWAGVHSSLEYRYVRDVERPHGLPRGQRQVRADGDAGTIYRDVLYDGYGVAVELDGRPAHPADRRWHDIRRDNAAAADGIVTLRYGWLEVGQQPCRVAGQVGRVLGGRGFAGSRGCSPGCPAGAAAIPAPERKAAG
jgi:hypothetical protein